MGLVNSATGLAAHMAATVLELKYISPKGRHRVSKLID